MRHRPVWRNALGVAALAATLTGACSDAEPPPVASPSPPVATTPGPADPSPSPTATTTAPSPAVGLGQVRVRLREVARLDGPVAMAVRLGDPALYVAEIAGRVVALRGDGFTPTPVLDLADRVSVGGERGLLGIAFSPDGRFLYANYTDVNGDTQIDEFPVTGEGAIDGARRRPILSIAQPFSNHNGGNLVFGPDGFLYVGMGDGGSGGDPLDNAQNTGQLLGKMLRIEPRPRGDSPYGIPPGNPFASVEGGRPEIWALGLRNPWRYSFDRETGDLWIGDVGQNSREEIDVQPAASPGGENYGWSRAEGTLGDTSGSTPPVFEYATGEGGTCAVTGGYVYRGRAIPGLAGAYVYADFCVGEVRALRLDGGRVAEEASLGVRAESLASFGEDRRGELYVLSLAGQVLRIDPA